LDPGCAYGGILRVLELRDSYPKELAYDFRTHFQLSVFELGKSISWVEAVYLISALMAHPNSHLQAAVNNWKYPVSYEWIVLSHIFDLLAMSNSKKKPKPYPTPWPDPNVNRLKPHKAQSRSDVLKQLRRMNPKE
jgi:hypothetical protein